VLAAAAAGLALLAGPRDVVLDKTLALLLMPTGAVWAVVTSTWAWRLGAAAKTDVKRLGAHTALVVALTVTGNDPLAQTSMAALEAPYLADPNDAGHFDAVVVLGGGASASITGVAEAGLAGDRILLGARLFARGQTPVLLATGTPIAGFEWPLDSTALTASMWRDLGIPDDAIVRVQNTRTTREEAVAVAALVAEHQWKRIGLVTSAWHLRRASRLFERAGVTVTPIAADHRGSPSWNGLYSVIPTGTAAYHFQKSAWEWIGAAVGR
jgi:uncharacterized SAM-binding protein YcdF (DUF218 family)